MNFQQPTFFFTLKSVTYELNTSTVLSLKIFIIQFALFCDKYAAKCRDVEIFLNMLVTWTNFENLASPNNKICNRNINILSVQMKFF